MGVWGTKSPVFCSEIALSAVCCLLASAGVVVVVDLVCRARYCDVEQDCGRVHGDTSALRTMCSARFSGGRGTYCRCNASFVANVAGNMGGKFSTSTINGGEHRLEWATTSGQ